MKKILSLFFLLTIQFNYATAQNFRAVTEFFKLADSLQSGYSIRDSAWKSFFELEGNKYYIEANGVSVEYTNQVRKACELVFKPGNDTLVNRLRASDYFINNYYQVKLNLDFLKAFTNRLQSINIVDSMYVRAVECLPLRMHPIKTQPKVYYEIIDFYGSADKHNIINSLWGSYLADPIKVGAYGGHEMHHFLRTSVPLKSIANEDKGIMWALEAILTEGTADMVNMRYWPMIDEYRDYVKKMTLASPGMLSELNNALETMYKDKKNADRKYFSDLFENTNGHFPGNFMATVIVENGYRQKMLDRCDDPFQFVYLYNKAARKANHAPVFSKSAIQQLKQLEKRYKL